MGECVLFSAGGKSVSKTKEKYYIYNKGKELNGHKITFYHRSGMGNDLKDLNWIYIDDWFMSVTSTDKILCKGYSKVFIAGMGDGRSSNVGTRFTYLKLMDEDGATISNDNSNDYLPNGNIIASLTLAEYFENTSSNTSSFGGVYSIDIPVGVTGFYLKIQNVNLDSYITAIWLE